MIDIKQITGIAFIILLLAVFFYQINRIWKIRTLMRNFLLEMEKLNNNLENITRYIYGKSKTVNKPVSAQSICKNCMFRLTFVNPGSTSVFSYQCRLDSRKITLKDTCKRFQKDLQSSQI